MSQLSVQAGTGGGPAIGTVVGSWANPNGTSRAIGQQMQVDPSIASAFTGAGTSYIVFAEVQYPFQPTGLYVSMGPITLQDSVMMIPRTAAQITVQ